MINIIKGTSVFLTPIIIVGSVMLYIWFVAAPNIIEERKQAKQDFYKSCFARGGTIQENYGGWAGTPPYICSGIK